MSPPQICTDKSISSNTTNSSCRSSIVCEDVFLNTQDNYILDILEELQCSVFATNNISFDDNSSAGTEKTTLPVHAVFGTIFNLNRKVLS